MTAGRRNDLRARLADAQLCFPFVSPLENICGAVSKPHFDVRRTPTYLALEPYVGERFAWLIFRLGYHSLADLADQTQYAVNSHAGIGPRRIASLNRALKDHKLSFRTGGQTENVPTTAPEFDTARTSALQQRRTRLSFHLVDLKDANEVHVSTKATSRAHTETPHLRLVKR